MQDNHDDRNEISRRSILKVAGLGALLLPASSLLAACTSPGQSTATGTPIPSGTPKRGGVMRVGVTGGGPTDTLAPAAALTTPSYAAGALIFDALSGLDRNAQIELRLAQEITPNADATVWTIKLKEGITFHNGKPATADDLIYTFQQVCDPKSGSVNAPMLAPVDVKNIKKVDNLTVQVPCKTPFSSLADVMSTYNFFSLLPVGFDPKKPIGTGPYKFVSHTPGQKLVVSRNDSYWVKDEPYFDSVEITNYPDETSQLNALIAKQVDTITSLTAASIPQIQNAGMYSIASKGGGWTPIVMRTDVAPFNNPDVVQAMKLLVDREQMLKVIFNGEGQVANDLFGIYDPAFNSSIPQRPHDPEKAKSLLKKAGAENLTVEMTTSAIAIGTVQLATVFAQQASQVGVTVNVKTVDPSAFFGPAWLSRPLTVDFWAYAPYFGQAVQSNYPGMFDETHFDNKQWNALYEQSMRTPDATSRTALVHEMQQIEWDNIGYCIPYNYPQIDGFAANVRGAQPSKVGYPLNFFADLKTMYFAS